MRLIWPKNIIRTQSNKRFKQNESSLLLLAKRHRLRSINEVRIFIFDSFSKTQLIPNLLHPSIFYPILNQPKQPKSSWLLHSILDKIKLFYLNKFFVNLFLRLVLQKNTTNWVKKLEMKKVEKRKKNQKQDRSDLVLILPNFRSFTKEVAQRGFIIFYKKNGFSEF